MSARIEPQPDGKYLVRCLPCHAQATTGLIDTARRWAREHRCQPENIRPNRSAK